MAQVELAELHDKAQNMSWRQWGGRTTRCLHQSSSPTAQSSIDPLKVQSATESASGGLCEAQEAGVRLILSAASPVVAGYTCFLAFDRMILGELRDPDGFEKGRTVT